MCFTIEVHTTRKAIEKRFKVDTSALYDFEFNYFYRAFTNPMIPLVQAREPDKAVLMQWGLIPHWSRDIRHAEQIRKGTYNARAETLHERSSFMRPLERGRCLILAHGFYEWQHTPEARIPWYIRLKDDGLLGFAGLCDSWKDPDSGRIMETCSIVTTRANPLMEKIHNTKKRMPVILTRETEARWLDQKTPTEEAGQLLLPFDQDGLEAWTISGRISYPETDPGDEKLIRPHDYPVPGTLF